MLSEIQARVLGCLMEKKETTPEQYPLTTNSLRLACNQKTARNPVSHYSEGEVGHAVRELIAMGLVREAWGARVAKYEHEAGKALGQSGDNGVDGVINQDSLGLDRVYIQAKRYSQGNSVGPGAIRDFFGSLDLHKASKGLFVTTSTFTKEAINTAERQSRRIVLIDGNRLTQLMIQHNIGCREEHSYSVKKIDEDFFE